MTATLPDLDALIAAARAREATPELVAESEDFFDVDDFAEWEAARAQLEPTFTETIAALTARLGAPSSDGEFPDWYPEAERAVTWTTGDCTVYLVLAQHDKELPIIIELGAQLTDELGQ